MLGAIASPALKELTKVMGSGSQTRRLLLIGFGGLLLLLAVAGLNGISVVNTIQSRNERIRADYVSREHILEQLRSDIYLSGTYVRDLLLEPDASLADIHRKELDKVRARIDTNTASYSRILLNEERRPFRQFITELHQYFALLSPALLWRPAERRQFGYSFTEHSLLPRRTEVVRLADQLSLLNEKQLATGNRNVRELFKNFEQSLIVTMALSLGCGALLAGVSVQRLLRLERISSARFQEVLQARTTLRDLSARLLEVQETERRAISRELHDEVGQSVSGLLLGIGNVAATLSREANAEAFNQLQDLRRLAEKTVAVVRDLSLLLRPSMLDDLGLLPALQWQAREISRTKNIAVRVSSEVVSEGTLSDEQKTCIYRVVQEALQNVVRHAEASAVEIKLTGGARRVSLIIEDNGRGFVPARDKGVGLLGMQERVHYLNGNFRVESDVGTGTRIHIDLPTADVSKLRLA